MSDKLRDGETDYLFQAILSLKSLDECYAFFEDVCTVSELKAMSQRMAVAKLLYQEKTYAEISQLTGASTATISRVNRCFAYGQDGYKIALKNLSEPHEEPQD